MAAIRFVYRVEIMDSHFPPHCGIESLDQEMKIGSFLRGGKVRISEHIAIIEVVPNGYRTIWRNDWFLMVRYFDPDDHAPAVQRLSELGLNEYAMDLIRQAKDAGFIAPELAPVLRL